VTQQTKSFLRRLFGVSRTH